MGWNRKRSVVKNRKNCLPLGPGVQSSFWILWTGHLREARSELARWAVSAIFEKWHFVIKPYFLLFEARISCVFLIFLLRSIKAYLCPNMINFDAVDFSERRPEEVISIFDAQCTLLLIQFQTNGLRKTSWRVFWEKFQASKLVTCLL